MTRYLESWAILSTCEQYRYRLFRRWEPGKPVACVVMLNPSTADAMEDDATIRSCVRILSSHSFGGMEVVNLFALRATDPMRLKIVADPHGPNNQSTLEEAVRRYDHIIFAWGAHPSAAVDARLLDKMVKFSFQGRAFCFGKTKAGHPKHPLYLRTGVPLEEY